MSRQNGYRADYNNAYSDSFTDINRLGGRSPRASPRLGHRNNLYLPQDTHSGSYTLPPRYDSKDSKYDYARYGSDHSPSSDRGKGLPRVEVTRAEDDGDYQRAGRRYGYATDYDQPLKEPKTFGGVLTRFADNTSLMGVPFIHIAKRWYSKLLWIVIFMGCAAGCAFHTYLIVSEYVGFRTSSSVSITYEQVEFPSVTVCNVNPLRSSYIKEYGTKELNEFFLSLIPSSEYNDEYKDFEEPEDYGENSLNDLTTTVGRKKRQAGGGGGQRPGGRTEAPLDGAGRTGGPQDGPGSDVTTEVPSESTPSPPAAATDPPLPPPAKKGRPDDDDGDEPAQVGVADGFDPDDYDFYAPDGNVGGKSDGISGTYLIESIYESLMSEIPRSNRTQMGHQRKAMILSCSYNGLTCELGNFTSVLNLDYGSCYTFNSATKADSSLVARRSGKSRGLELFLFAEDFEYLKGFTHEQGFTVTIHPFNTIPFVSENSVAVPTGSATYIGMRTIKQTRLGGKYGACGDNGVFEGKFGRNYTIDSCVNTCLDSKIQETCGCYRNVYIENYPTSFTKKNSACDMTLNSKDSTCVAKLNRQHTVGLIDCDCKPACTSDSYDFHVSTNNWPDISMWYTLVNTVCNRDDWGCYYLQQHEDTMEQTLRRNFAKLTIYYRDLNVQLVEEQAAYSDEQFWSDFGGCIGLWIGASVLTVFECFDLFVSCCAYCCKRGEYKKRKKLIEAKQKEIDTKS